MILDSSAIIAIVFQEHGYEEVKNKIDSVDFIGVGAPTLVETAIVLSARLGKDARGMIARFLNEIDATIIPFTEVHFGVAVNAWMKYGKGRHPAGLNFGDCLAYAIANMANLPLLFVGEDFKEADVEIA